MPYLSYARDFQGVADVFLRAPTLYAPLLQFIEAVMTGPSALSPAEREMIATHVSRLNGCAFCLGAHKATLAAMDVDLAAIEALEGGGRDDTVLDGKLLALLAFAGKLTKTPGAIAQGDIDALTQAGWDEQSIEDAANVTALFNYVNRLVEAVGIEGEESYFRQIGKTLATRGYAPLTESLLQQAR